MRSTKKTHLGFFVCLLINIVLNIEGSFPAWILLACHFIFDISIWWFWGALALWIIVLISWMYFVGWAAACGSEPDKPKPNKNPYSNSNASLNIAGSEKNGSEADSKNPFSE